MSVVRKCTALFLLAAFEVFAQGPSPLYVVTYVELRPPAKSERLPAKRMASFHRQYPVGGSQARIWNRALARTDEVRRVPGPDPRDGHALDLP